MTRSNAGCAVFAVLRGYQLPQRLPEQSDAMPQYPEKKLCFRR